MPKTTQGHAERTGAGASGYRGAGIEDGVLDLTLAHSPDSDDAFMFYALATNKVRTDGVKLTHILEDIQTLNEKALREVYDVTAVSIHAYAYIADNYILLPSGASFGDG